MPPSFSQVRKVMPIGRVLRNLHGSSYLQLFGAIRLKMWLHPQVRLLTPTAQHTNTAVATVVPYRATFTPLSASFAHLISCSRGRPADEEGMIGPGSNDGMISLLTCRENESYYRLCYKDFCAFALLSLTSI